MNKKGRTTKNSENLGFSYDPNLEVGLQFLTTV